jgi:signal transduction histidine kinase
MADFPASQQHTPSSDIGSDNGSDAGHRSSLPPDLVAHLQEAALAVTASLETGDVLGRIVKATRVLLLPVDAVVLFGRAPFRADLPVLAADGLPQDVPAIAEANTVETAVGRALREQQVVGVEDLTSAPADRRRRHSFAEEYGFRSVLAAPLATGGERLGALAVYARERRPWSHEDATLLSLFASHAAVALQNARLFERLNRRAWDLQALFELTHLLNAHAEREPLLADVIVRLAGWMGARYGAMMLVEPPPSSRGGDGNSSGAADIKAEMKIRAWFGFPDEYIARANKRGGITLDPAHIHGNGPASVAVRETRPVAVGDVFLDDRFAPFRPYAVQVGYLSLVAVPLVGQQGRVWGSVVLYFAQRRDFGEAELKLLSAVADGVALALDRIDLNERLLRDAVERRADMETDRLKGEFVSTVSHELRTPLTIIKGYTDLVESEQAGPVNETQRKFLQGVQRNTTRLTELVSDLLDIGRLESSSATNVVREMVDLARLVADACGEFDRVAGERNIAVVCAPPLPHAAAVPPVWGDGQRLHQVTANLLSNAVKYSPAGATVTLSCAAENGEVVVRVRDQGPGIPLEAQARLFQRFYRVDSSSTRKVGGTGLGLAIAKAIVEQHQGRIWVNSQPGEGSEFAFALPALPAAAPEEQSQPTAVAAASARNSSNGNGGTQN